MPEDTIIEKVKKVITPEERQARIDRAAETRLANAGKFTEADRGNKYRIVQGVMLRQADVAKWEYQKFIDFFTFLDRFYEFKGEGDGKVSVTLLKIQQAELDLKENPEGSFAEFMWRINQWTEPFDGAIHKKFYIRVATLMRIVFQYCKKHPTVIGPEIQEFCKGKVQYQWILENYHVTKSNTGVEIVQESHIGYQGNSMNMGVSSAKADEKMLNAIVKVADVFEMIAGSISKKEIEKMSITQKINSLQKLSFVQNLVKGFKPNSIVFKQMNINKAGKDELEQALLDFNKEGE